MGWRLGAGQTGHQPLFCPQDSHSLVGELGCGGPQPAQALRDPFRHPGHRAGRWAGCVWGVTVTSLGGWWVGGRGVGTVTAQGSPRLSGREVRAHPHAYLPGHRSSLAGRGECSKRGQARAWPARRLGRAPDVRSGWGRPGGWARGTARPCCPQITFLCDLLLLYVDGEAHFYWRSKYEEVRCARRGLGAACLGPQPEPRPAAVVLRQRLQRGPPTPSRRSWHPHPRARPSRGLRGHPAPVLTATVASGSWTPRLWPR